MQSTVYIPVSEATYNEVYDFLKSQNVSRSVVSVLQQFIEYAKDNAEWKTDSFFPEAIVSEINRRSYIWKHRDFRRGIELPSGTEIKMTYKGRDYLGLIVEGSIKYNGTYYKSMSKLASHIAGNTSRSAPRDISIKRPNESGWTSALQVFNEINR